MSRVAVISFSHLRSDPRVRKQLEILTPDHEVVTIGHGEAPDGVAHHLQVPSEFQGWQYPRQLVVSRQYWQAYAGNPAVAFVREQAGRATRERSWLARGSMDAVVANDVETAGIAQWLAPRRGVHLDLHEFARSRTPNCGGSAPSWHRFCAGSCARSRPGLPRRPRSVTRSPSGMPRSSA